MAPDHSAVHAALAAGDKATALAELTKIARAGQADGETWYLCSLALEKPADQADALTKAKAAGWQPAAPEPPKQPEPPAPKIESVVAPQLASPAVVAPAASTVNEIFDLSDHATPPKRRSVWLGIGGVVVVLLLIALGGGIYLQRAGSPMAVLTMATPTTATTPTPHSCLDQSGAWIAQIDPLLKEWQDARRLASLTARVSLQPAVAKLQELKRTADATTPPECAVEAKRRLLVSMDSTIRGFEAFMLNFDLVSQDEIKAADTAYGTFERAYGRLKAGEPILTPTNTPTS